MILRKIGKWHGRHRNGRRREKFIRNSESMNKMRFGRIHCGTQPGGGRLVKSVFFPVRACNGLASFEEHDGRHFYHVMELFHATFGIVSQFLYRINQGALVLFWVIIRFVYQEFSSASIFICPAMIYIFLCTFALFLVFTFCHCVRIEQTYHLIFFVQLFNISLAFKRAFNVQNPEDVVKGFKIGIGNLFR